MYQDKIHIAFQAVFLVPASLFTQHKLVPPSACFVIDFWNSGSLAYHKCQ
jgi:hypothetical protein